MSKRKRKGVVLLLTFLLAAILAMPYAETTHAARLKLSKTKATLIRGGQLRLKVTGTTKKVKWSSNQNKVATVNSKGLVRAKSKGTAKITAKVGKKRSICKITVRAPKKNTVPEYLRISDSRIQMKVGEFKTLRAYGTTKKVEWYSTDTRVAEVSDSGVVYGVRAGDCRIYAEILGQYQMCMVSVYENTDNTVTPTAIPTIVSSITPTTVPTSMPTVSH